MRSSLHNIYLTPRTVLTDSEEVFTEPEVRRRGGGPRPLSAAEKITKFWGKINKTDGCWLWTGGVTPDGYGLVCLGRRPDGRQLNDYAHRAAYRLSVGPIPDGLVIRHACDTPRCCNPDHLLLGTQAENIEDARKQGKYRAAALARWARAPQPHINGLWAKRSA